MAEATTKVSKKRDRSSKTKSPNKRKREHSNEKESVGKKKAKKRSDQNKVVKKDESKSKPADGAKKEVWSKSKKKRMRKALAKMKKNGQEPPSNPGGDTKAKKESTPSSEPEKETNLAEIFTLSEDKTEKDTVVNKKGPTPLHKAYAARLAGSRFRILNEELYTTTSESAFQNFQSNPELFDQYHVGFRQQVSQWPSNPVDIILQWLAKKYGNSTKTTVVADFGAGDAALAKGLLKANDSSEKKAKKKAVEPFKVHSFDLVAKSDLITACDMADVPLEDNSVDVAIFCLALMGTNVADFLVEANRVLKENGLVKIAEVRSRFESTKGTDDLDDFLEKLKLLGFECQKVDRSNKMFVMIELKKNSRKPDKSVDVKIKPCIYKRR